MYYSYVVHKISMNTLRYNLVCTFTCLVIVVIIIIHLFTNFYGFYFLNWSHHINQSFFI